MTAASNPRIPYCLSTDRARLAPPSGKRLVVHLILNVECWPFEAPMPRGVITAPHGAAPAPDVVNFSWYEYGMRCGLPRIVQLMQRLQVRASCSLNAAVIDVYPDCAALLREAGFEFIGHGYVQRMLALDTERDVIRRTLDKIRAFTTVAPQGWQGPGLVETHRTPELLKAAGVRYVCDWGLDDLPTWMRTAHGPLIAIPGNVAIDDSIVFAIEKHTAGEMLQRLVDTLEAFSSENDDQTRIIPIAVHPHLVGEPHRFPYFRRMLELLKSRQDVVFMTGSEIADWFEAQEPADSVDWSRVVVDS